MKAQLITVCIVILNLILYCQETELIVKKFKGSKQIFEEYYVLKSDKSTKHGKYTSYFRFINEDYKKFRKGDLNLNEFIKNKGNFENGKKEGDWTEFTEPSALKSVGNYYSGKKGGEWIEYISPSKKRKGIFSNSEKTGVWITYKNDKVIASYDYDNDKKVGVWLTEEEHGQVFTRYDYGNNKELQPLVYVDLKYPLRAKEYGIQGKVIASYRINQDCTIDNINIIESLSEYCDKSVIEAIEKMGDLQSKYCKECKEEVITKEFTFKLVK